MAAFGGQGGGAVTVQLAVDFIGIIDLGQWLEVNRVLIKSAAAHSSGSVRTRSSGLGELLGEAQDNEFGRPHRRHTDFHDHAGFQDVERGHRLAEAH